MHILGLHFGHDAAASILSNGSISSYVLRERNNRVKHALGLTRPEIDGVLNEAGLVAADIDSVAITSTQNVELLTGLIDGLDIDMTPHDAHGIPATLIKAADAANTRVEDLLVKAVEPTFRGNDTGFESIVYRKVFPEGASIDWDRFDSVGWLDGYITDEAWRDPVDLETLAKQTAELKDELRFGFHLPVTVGLDGREIPGYFVNHHMAHAASCYYRSGFRRAAILTHDGFRSGTSYHGGFFAFGDGTRLWPLSPHYLAIGVLYEMVAASIGLGEVGGPGKLMGLASYGKPVLFDDRFVCNEPGAKSKFGTALTEAWLTHCKQAIQQRDYDLEVYGDTNAMTAPVNADIAASTQKLFEEIYLAAVSAMNGMLENAAIPCDSLCLSGGTALNCPSNTRVAAEGPFDNVYVEPSCDDGGLSVGASLHLYHNLMDAAVQPPEPYASPYLGRTYTAADTDTARQAFDVEMSSPGNPARAAAMDINEDRVIGWFEGGSETGPRALGHRSILSNATKAENWPRVNVLKKREAWRPFAPAVLEEDADAWFEGCPIPSPYMLFNARVKGPGLSAITHVDGTARIQTVDPSCGQFFKVLMEYKALSGIPVVLNTSFNGPGEPIVETPDEALRFLTETDIDAVYIDGRRFTRR